MNNDINEKIVHAAPVPPFVRFVASAVPMVFDNSLSYYEALCALWKWLQDDVIDVINNNATVTEHYIELDEETRQLFIELKSYVDNYFDNLDVQEEINNKLDDMSESGELQRIIAEYLKTQIIYDTTLDMIADASNLVDGVRVETLGYRTVDDNGASFFVIKNAGTADGKGVIDLQNGLYAHMIYKHDFVTPEMFGAYGDGVNDHNDSDAIQYAINTGKTVEFAPKTYTCYSLSVEAPSVLHGNGATLKRPELDIAPYSLTVSEMKWIRTITVHEDCTINNLNFDNNCFTMWQVSDGYTQEQSASVIVSNDSKQIKFSISNCHFKNSAGDGLHIVQNVNANISNCTSEDCFRGGFVSSGYGSEINLNGWNSKVITAGVNDGFDIEVDSNSTINPSLFIVNINNVVLDYDLDLGIPNDGICNVNNLTMREFDGTLYNGFITNCRGVLTISNSIIRTGTHGTIVQRLGNGGHVTLNNCQLFNDTQESLFGLQTGTSWSNGKEQFIVNNCEAKCYDFIQMGINYGVVKIVNSNIECTNSLAIASGAVGVQPNHMYISDTSIKFASVLMQLVKTVYATFADGVNLHLDNVKLSSNETSTEIYCAGGKPNLYFGNLTCDTPLVLHKVGGGSPILIGDKRIVTVATATDLTFAGWIAGNDIAVARDTGTRYQYTSGTTWTAI